MGAPAGPAMTDQQIGLETERREKGEGGGTKQRKTRKGLYSYRREMITMKLIWGKFCNWIKYVIESKILWINLGMTFCVDNYRDTYP